MAILEAGTMTPDTELFCPSSIEADGYVITDAHERGDATYTLQQIMDQSSNIGISLATENATVGDVSGFRNLYNKINEYNLHTKTGVDYPGEGEAGTDYLGACSRSTNGARSRGTTSASGRACRSRRCRSPASTERS